MYGASRCYSDILRNLALLLLIFSYKTRPYHIPYFYYRYKESSHFDLKIYDTHLPYKDLLYNPFSLVVERYLLNKSSLLISILNNLAFQQLERFNNYITIIMHELFMQFRHMISNKSGVHANYSICIKTFCIIVIN